MTNVPSSSMATTTPTKTLPIRTGTLPRRAGAANDRHAPGAVRLWLHAQRHVGVRACRRRLRLPLGLSDAQGLVADRRCALAFDRAWRRWRLHARPALRARRVHLGWAG